MSPGLLQKQCSAIQQTHCKHAYNFRIAGFNMYMEATLGALDKQAGQGLGLILTKASAMLAAVHAACASEESPTPKHVQ